MIFYYLHIELISDEKWQKNRWSFSLTTIEFLRILREFIRNIYFNHTVYNVFIGENENNS